MKRLVVVNLLLGIPGIAYYWMLTLMIGGAPMTTWGQQLVDLYAATSLLPMQSLLGPPLAICTMVWLLSNFNLLADRIRSGEVQTAGSRATHWGVALAMSLVPALLLFLVALFF